MKFTANRKALSSAVKSMLPAVGKRATLPVLAGVRIEVSKARVSVEATDLETSIRRTLTTGVSVGARGCIVVAARPLAKALSTLAADEITIESESADGRTRVTIQAGSRSLTIDALPVGEADLASLPEEVVRRLFEAFRLQVRYDAGADLARCRVTISGDSLDQMLADVALAVRAPSGERHARAPVVPGPLGSELTIAGSFEVVKQASFGRSRCSP